MARLRLRGSGQQSRLRGRRVSTRFAYAAADLGCKTLSDQRFQSFRLSPKTCSTYSESLPFFEFGQVGLDGKCVLQPVADLIVASEDVVGHDLVDDLGGRDAVHLVVRGVRGRPDTHRACLRCGRAV